MKFTYQDICSKVYSLDQTRSIEKKAIQQFSDDFLLMKKAGKFCFQCIQYHFKKEIKKMIVFCGKGNNGGDGYIVAALAKESGIDDVCCVEVGDFRQQKVTAKKAKKIAEKFGVEIKRVSLLRDDFFYSLKDENSVVVDALLGIGAKRIFSKEHEYVIEKINEFASFIVAVDTPSGICTDSGVFNNTFIQASITVTFITLKTGLMLAKESCGKVYFSDLKIPQRIIKPILPEYFLLPPKNVVDFFPDRDVSSHKGNFGHLLIIGGNVGMNGSVILAAEAAFRSGVGKVTVASKKETLSALLVRLPEVMTLDITNLKDKKWKEILKDKDAVIVGPGLGNDKWAEEICFQIFSHETKKVIDADALYFLAESRCKNSSKKSKIKKKIEVKNSIFTPHPKEASALLGEKIDFVVENRKEAIVQMKIKYDSSSNENSFVLKGNKSLILGRTNTPFIDISGNAGMATAGSGDVLSGILGSLLAQGFSTENAAIVGVSLHGQAGDKAKQNYGESSLLASDITNNISTVLK